MKKVDSPPGDSTKTVQDPDEKVFTGGNFMDYKELVKIVSEYQQRTFCEDVDEMEKQSAPIALMGKLQTSLEEGIKTSSITERTEAFGTNKPPQKEIKTCCGLFGEALNDLTLIILIVAAVVSIIINMITEEEHRSIAWVEGAAILAAVGISAGVQAVNDYEKEKQFRELNETAIASKKVTVLRDGKEVDVQLGDVVVGDIVTIIAGDEIAGDGILLNGSSVMTDEASMTGESDVMHKEPVDVCIKKRNKIQEDGNSNTAGGHDVPSPVLLSGTAFQNGKGKMLVIAVGDESAIGKIRKTLVDGDDETPLQRKLNKIARDIGMFGLVSAIITFTIMVIRAIIEMGKHDWKWSKETTTTIVEGFLVGITVLVVAIPEGLPLAVTLSLAFSVKKMLADKNLVRKLHACETMGGANIICSDKTGTLTMNKMFLTHFWNCEGQQIYNNETSDIVNCTEFIKDKQLTIFHQVTCCNSTADPEKESGNPTELSIVRYMSSCGVNPVSIRKRYTTIAEEPFSSERKRMSTLIKDDDGKDLMLIKGASELILEGCDKLLDLKSGDIKPLDQATKEDVLKAISDFAKMSLRTIGLAYSYPENYDKDNKGKDNVLACEKSGLTLVGICGIKDVIRPEVPQAIESCRTAGVEVKMVTGDNKITARAIALECGIILEGEDVEFKDWQVMLGKDFYEYVEGHVVTKGKKTKKKSYKVKNIKKFEQIYKHIRVLARSRPEDKLTMVVGLRETGNIVAVTGDGTNDAPALSKANVGFAMGITGTEIAKQAADILLTDDNFNSIVSAVKWGRNIYDSIRKFLQFQLTVNIVAVLITLVSAAITQESVLTAVQMLWVNLIMDTLASLALATEPPTEALLTRPPIPPTASIVSKKMTKHIIGQAIYQFIVLLIFLFLGTKFLMEEIDDSQKANPAKNNLIKSGLKQDGYDKYVEGTPSRHGTYTFNVFVMMTVFNFVNARKLYDEFNVLKGIFGSCFFPVIVIAIFILQFIIVTVGGLPLGCCKWGLGPIGWCICIAFGLVGLIWRLVIRMLPEDKICPAFGSKSTKPEDKNKLSSLSIKRSLSRKSSSKANAKGDYK